jgi:MFS family permease
MTGISAVSTYAAEIAEGNLTNFKSILPSIINFEQVVTTLISSFLLSKFGRKTILQYGTFGAGLTTFIIGIGFLIQYAYPNASVFLILNGLFLFMANFGLSIGPIVWIYIAEIVKPEILPYTTMMNWGSSAMILLLFPIIKKTLWNENPSLLFLVFSIWCSLSYLINRKYIIETMGKTEEEIRKEY